MRLSFWTLVSVFAWVILIALLVVPLGSVLLSSLQDQAGDFTLANYARFVETPRFRTAFVNTLIVGFGGLVGSLLLGSAMAFCMARIEIRGSPSCGQATGIQSPHGRIAAAWKIGVVWRER